MQSVLIGVLIGVKRYLVSRLWGRDHFLTAKDAGWREGSVFVAPMTFIPIDPPEPRKRPTS